MIAHKGDRVMWFRKNKLPNFGYVVGKAGVDDGLPETVTDRWKMQPIDKGPIEFARQSDIFWIHPFTGIYE